ncbi:hypothetical protein C2857_007051 [Epichloe festucae Fl1]|uniref:Biogenesis of lysosome-related organelles complex 1 subunit 1 n=1 Tax=Epichloe festucae (strain Fl1) TaxID=877507 RepID=A0A7S9PUU9_EPIFF|nr:hypothetical protein C2857_007051 [Epichloe festucae Fl1]
MPALPQPSSSLPMPSATTTSAHAQPIHAHAPTLHQTLPSAETQRHVAEARSAVVASMGNLLDSELQSRAGILHENAAALDRQERDVLRATEGLRREREKLAREAGGAARKVKELGNVQNWAEVLERGFLVLEETVRLANKEGSASCSCSECGCGWSDDADERAADVGFGAEGTMDVDVDLANSLHRQNGMTLKDGEDKGVLVPHGVHLDVDMSAEADEGGRSAWSDASRSLLEPPDSSTGTGRAKGSETASLSTEEGKRW